MHMKRVIAVAGCITVTLAVCLVWNMDIYINKLRPLWIKNVVASSANDSRHHSNYSSVVVEITSAEDKPLHQSCSARFPQNWNADLQRRTNEFRVSQCMLPSPAAEYKPRPTEWADDEPWRKEEAEKLSKVVQQELHELQNPSNCSSARVLLCTFHQHCGMGCKLHHVVHCLALAYASRRMVLMVKSGYPYQQQNWWNDHFLPLSDTCNLSHFEGVKDVMWTETTALGSHPVVRVGLARETKWIPALYPVAVPRHLVERLFRLHCAPHVWWVGQLLTFLVRPAPKLQASLESLRAKIGFHKPIIGLHIRHTDKGSEAALQPLSTYMAEVKIFLRYHGHENRTRIFLATDDPNVVREARTKYSQYQWVVDESATQMAVLEERYSVSALVAAILDLLLLSETDYLVCTFSSNLCRAAYELMQTRFGDGSWRVTSLDQPYYFHGQLDYTRIASQDHVTLSGGELNFTQFDSVRGGTPVGRIHCQGRNLRTGQQGIYLASKVRLQTPALDFPTLNLDKT